MVILAVCLDMYVKCFDRLQQLPDKILKFDLISYESFDVQSSREF